MKMIQIRNVPEPLHRALKVRAAREGITMSELIMRELPRIAQRPSNDEVLARIRRRRERGELLPADSPSPAEIIREHRGPI
jgi:hypothetical protein